MIVLAQRTSRKTNGTKTTTSEVNNRSVPHGILLKNGIKGGSCWKKKAINTVAMRRKHNENPIDIRNILSEIMTLNPSFINTCVLKSIF